MLAAYGDGKKIKPTVVFKGTRTRTKLNAPGLNIIFTENGWMNENSTVEWVRKSLTR